MIINTQQQWQKYLVIDKCIFADNGFKDIQFVANRDANQDFNYMQFQDSTIIQNSIFENNSGAISNYPFDEYQGSWRSFLEDFQTSMSLASTLTLSERPIYGWEMSVEPIKLPNDIAIGKNVNLDGKQAFEWNAHRSGSIKLSFFLLIAVMILGTVSAIILTKSIYLLRSPPTLGALSWLATSLFAVLEIRSRFPGNPPLGISADLFVTYPVSVILLGLILTNTYFWINRDDWDMKNRPNATNKTPITLFRKLSMRSFTKFLMRLAVIILRISKLKKVRRIVPRNKNSMLLLSSVLSLLAMDATLSQ